RGQAHGGDGEAVTDLFDSTGGIRLDALGGVTSLFELGCERHAEACRVSGGQQFFRVGALVVPEAGPSRIVAADGACLALERSVATLQTPFPLRARLSRRHHSS